LIEIWHTHSEVEMLHSFHKGQSNETIQRLLHMSDGTIVA